MKDIKLTILFTLLIFFSGKAQSDKWLDSISHLKQVRINFQGALIANNSFSNFSKGQSSNNSSDFGFTSNNSKPICFGFNAGVEFVFGERPRFKQLLSITYDLTNSLYNDYRVALQAYRGADWQTWHETISRQVQFVNLNGGFLFNITKKLKLATMFSIAMYTTRDITNGYYVDNFPARPTGNGPTYNILPASSDTTNYNNSKTIYKPAIEVSFKLRASYDITKYISVFAQRNFGVSYIAPWWMLGLQFYPFKNFR
ncbi:MAG TPA: hypothetical protein VNX01_15285 [Bacteroidia bacterium]|jgi:hypothetical protein|nr:hypothetical protein [Bacteroidia bacterium]